MKRILILGLFLLTTCVQILYSKSWDSLHGPDGGKVTSFFIDHDTTMWIGTGPSGGVYVSEDDGKTWVERNNGLGLTEVHKFIEIDDKMYCEVRYNSYLDQRLLYSGDPTVSSTPTEEEVEGRLKYWFLYDVNSDNWTYVNKDDFEYEIVTSEWDKWSNNNHDLIDDVFNIEEKDNFVTRMTGGWFSTYPLHFPPDVNSKNIVEMKGVLYLYCDSGLYKLQNHTYSTDSLMISKIDSFKVLLKNTIETKWIPKTEKDSRLSKEEIDSLKTEYWDFYNSFNIWVPVSTNGIFSTSLNQILEMSDRLITSDQNFVWKYVDGTWIKIFDGYRNYFGTGEHYFVDKFEKVSEDTLLIYSEGDMFIWNNDSLTPFLNFNRIENSKSGDSLSLHFVSTNIDRGGYIWSIIDDGKSYWIVRFSDSKDTSPLFIREITKYSRDRFVSNYQVHRNPSPFIYKDESGILWLFGHNEVFQIGSGYDKNIKYEFSGVRFIPQSLVSSYKGKKLVFLTYNSGYIRPKSIVQWSSNEGWSEQDISRDYRYYFTSLVCLDQSNILLTTGYGPVHDNYRSSIDRNSIRESPGLVIISTFFEEGFSTRGTLVKKGLPNDWNLSSSSSSVRGKIYVGTMGTGVVEVNITEEDKDKIFGY